LVIERHKDMHTAWIMEPEVDYVDYEGLTYYFNFLQIYWRFVLSDHNY
jgi:hypothetical protein